MNAPVRKKYGQPKVIVNSVMNSLGGYSEASAGQAPVSPDNKFAVRTFTVLLLLSTALTLVSLLFHLYNLRAPESAELDELLTLMSVNRETSLPSWFSSKILFIAALLLGFFYLRTRRARFPGSRMWLGLSLIFLYLSVDEALFIHERVAGIFSRAFGLSGILYYAWVLPFSVLVLIFLAFYAPFFLRLPGRTRNLIALAGTLYLGGALGAEVVAALMDQSGNRETLAFIGIFTLEEWLEMTGISLFIFALLDYAARYLRPAAASGGPVRAREEPRGDSST